MAQRFTAAITRLSSEPALAAEARLPQPRMAPQWNPTHRKARDERGTPNILGRGTLRRGSAGLGIGGHVAARLAGRRIARGQIARGEVRLHQFAAPDKTPEKKRPALVLTRNSAIAYLSTITVAPVTSTIRGAHRKSC